MSQPKVHHAGPLVPVIMFDMSSQLIGCTPVVVCQATFSTKPYPKYDIEYYKSRFKEQLNNITDAHELSGKKAMFNLTVESMSMKALIEGAVRQKTFKWNEFGKIALLTGPKSVSTDWSVALALLAAQAADRYEMIPHTSANTPFPNAPGGAGNTRAPGDATSGAGDSNKLSNEEITTLIEEAISYNPDVFGDGVNDWATGTNYAVDTLVKDTSDKEIYRVTSDHTSSGDLPLTRNPNADKYILLNTREGETYIDVHISKLISKLKDFKAQIALYTEDYKQFLKNEIDRYILNVRRALGNVVGINNEPYLSHRAVIRELLIVNNKINLLYDSISDVDIKTKCKDVNNGLITPLYDALLGYRHRSDLEGGDFRYTRPLWGQGDSVLNGFANYIFGTERQVRLLAQMNTTNAQGAPNPTVFTPTTLLGHVGRAYVPRSFLMDICITLCGIYESGLAFTPRPNIPDSTGLQSLEKAKILIGIVSGLDEIESMKVFKAMCPSEGAAERFLVAFREWYNSYDDDSAKQFKAFYTTSLLNNALSKLFQGITADDEFPDSDEELCKLGIDFQATKAIFQLPLRGDPCLDPFHSALKTPARGHTLCRLAHPRDFVLKSNAIALDLPESTVLPFLDIVASHLHNAQDDAEIDFRNEVAGYRLLLKRISMKDRDLLRVWLDNLKEAVHSLETAIDTKPMTIGQLSEFVTDADATLQSVHNIIEDPTTLLPKLKERYRMYMIERMIQAHEDDSKHEQRALLDQLIGVLNDENLNSGRTRAMFDEAKAAIDPIVNLLEKKQVKRLLCNNSNLFMAFGHILFGR
jgi:hypothetical protein